MDTETYKYIIDNSKDSITLINRDYVYELANNTYCEQVNKRKDEVVGHTVAEVWGDEKFQSTIKDYIDRCLAGEHVDYVEEFTFGPFLKYMHVSYYPYYIDRDITHAVVFSHDITHVGKLESKLNHYEYRDPITGLFNRRSLDIVIEKEIQRAELSAHEQLRILLFIQLHNIEKVIEMYGQEVGDLLLENTGVRLKSHLITNDYVFRFDGLQFAVLLVNVENKDDAGKFAKKLYDTITFPYKFKGHDIIIGCSIGVAVYPTDGEERSELIQKATSAMLEAERRGDTFALYNQQLYEQSLRKILVESAAYRALKEQQFKLYYQPIVDENHFIVGAEALLRWKHPQLGDISPSEFIPMAEQSDLIYALGKWIMFSVCNQLVEWNQKYGIFVSMNLSSRQFSSPLLMENISSVLHSCQPVDPKMLKIEITENESLRNIEASIKRIKALENLGVEVFIDDFGTGHSSLQYLKRLPAKVLKIDREFVKDIDTDQEERDFLNHIIHMGYARNKRVLIEGVENAEQAKLLVEMGCNRMQGFYFSRPVTSDKLERLLEAEKPLPNAAIE